MDPPLTQETIASGADRTLFVKPDEGSWWCPSVAEEYTFSASVKFSDDNEPFAEIPTDVTGTTYTVICRPPTVTLP